MARVLLVDDDRAGLEIRRMIFEQAGHEAVTASSASEALAAPAPDAVILDLQLPELKDGLALIRELRAKVPGAKIIVLSGWPKDLIGRPEREMVDEVLLKPAHPSRLLSLI